MSNMFREAITGEESLQSIGALIGGVVLFVLVIWLGVDITHRAASIQAERQKLRERIAAVSAAATVKADFERARKYIGVLENILPTKDRLIQFPRELSAEGSRRGVEINAVFGAEEQGTVDHAGGLHIAMTLNGVYSSIVNFLGSVEQGTHIVQWDHLSLTAHDGNYQGEIGGKVLFQ